MNLYERIEKYGRVFNGRHHITRRERIATAVLAGFGLKDTDHDGVFAERATKRADALIAELDKDNDNG